MVYKHLFQSVRLFFLRISPFWDMKNRLHTIAKITCCQMFYTSSADYVSTCMALKGDRTDTTFHSLPCIYLYVPWNSLNTRYNSNQHEV